MSNERVHVHLHPGQRRAWQSRRRFVAITAGTQSGKTCFAPLWLYREIWRCGPGDYLFVTPTFPMLELKALPEFLRFFQLALSLGRYIASPRRIFTFSEQAARSLFAERFPEPTQPPTRVIFAYATDPESLESATCKAAVLDEAGQTKFKLDSWHAVLRRLSLSTGRVLITTSVYALNWLKTKIYDAWQAGDKTIDVITFDSTMNPAFPREEFERARRDLPRWKFEMLYRGRFARPAGLIYDCFDRAQHTCPRFTIPSEWKRYLGIDFGTQNMAAVYLAQEPESERLYLYRTYHRGGLSVPGHARAMLHGEPGIPYCVGGSSSEGEWRREFRAAGLPVREPDVQEVEIGIDRVYGAFQRGRVIVFDDLDEFLEEKQTYARVLDAEGNPTEVIEDKETFHLLDAERYIVARLCPAAPRRVTKARVDWYGR